MLHFQPAWGTRALVPTRLCISISSRQPGLPGSNRYVAKRLYSKNVGSVSAAAHDSTRNASSTTLPLRAGARRAAAIADEDMYRAQTDAFVGSVAVQAVPGAGIGMFTTEPVTAGQLLLVSQPLATVAVRPDAAASGPSRLIQGLLTRLLNPGEVEWLQLLNTREALANQHTALQDIQDSHVPLDSSSGSNGGGPGSGFKPLFTILQAAELQSLQAQSKGGGRLEQLQLTPMQLAEMVQDCAVTLDGPEAAAVANMLAALSTSSSSSRGRGVLQQQQQEEGSEELSVCGLWPEMGLMKQSCAANVTLTCLGSAAAAGVGGEVEGALLVVRAAKDMPAGTELFAPSLPASCQLLQCVEGRQQSVREAGLGDKCYCSRCAQEQQQGHELAQQQLAELSSTAAAAMAAMGHLLPGSQQQQQQQQQSRGRRPLGGTTYTGDDFETEDPDQAGVYDAEQFGVYDTAAAAGGSYRSSSGSRDATPELQQQQQEEVALEWLQLLVADMLDVTSSNPQQQQQLQQQHGQQLLLVPAACYSSWVAIRQALVLLQDVQHDSSTHQLLAAQLEHLITVSTSQHHSSSSSSDMVTWGELLLRVYDLQLQTLQQIAAGSLQHVLVASAAAAAAVDAGADQSTAAQELAGSFTAARQTAVAARFGNSLSSSSFQQLVGACLDAAAAEPGLMPSAAAAAGVGVGVHRPASPAHQNGNGASEAVPGFGQDAAATGSSSSSSSSEVLEVVEAVVVSPEPSTAAAAAAADYQPAVEVDAGSAGYDSSSAKVVSEVVIEVEAEQVDEPYTSAAASLGWQQQQQDADATAQASSDSQPWWSAAAAAAQAAGADFDADAAAAAAPAPAADTFVMGLENSHEDVDFPGDELDAFEDAFEDESGNVIWSAAAAAQAAAAAAPQGVGDDADDTRSSGWGWGAAAAAPDATEAATPWWSAAAAAGSSLFASAGAAAASSDSNTTTSGSSSSAGYAGPAGSDQGRDGEDEGPEVWSAAAAAQAAAAMAPEDWRATPRPDHQQQRSSDRFAAHQQRQQQQAQAQSGEAQSDGEAPKPRFSRFYEGRPQQPSQQQQQQEPEPAAADAAAASQPWVRGPLPSWVKPASSTSTNGRISGTYSRTADSQEQQQKPSWIKQPSNASASQNSSSSSSNQRQQEEEPFRPLFPQNTTARPAWGIPSIGGDWASLQQQQQQLREERQQQQQQQREAPRWAQLRRQQQQQQLEQLREQQRQQQEAREQQRQRRSALWRTKLANEQQEQAAAAAAAAAADAATGAEPAAAASAAQQPPRKSALWRAKMGAAAEQVTAAAEEVSGEAEAVATAAERMAQEAEAAAEAAEAVAATAAAAGMSGQEGVPDGSAAAAAAAADGGRLVGAFEAVAVKAEAEALAAERTAVAAERVAVAAERVALGAEQLAVLAAQDVSPPAPSSSAAAAAGAAMDVEPGSQQAAWEAEGVVAAVGGGEGAEGEVVEEPPVLQGNEGLPPGSVQRLQQLLEWTVEVGGPLTPSQQELVQQLVHGSSSSSGSSGGRGAVLDADQVLLLRKLVGLM